MFNHRANLQGEHVLELTKFLRYGTRKGVVRKISTIKQTKREIRKGKKKERKPYRNLSSFKET